MGKRKDRKCRKDIAAVIVTRNDKEGVATSIESLLGQTIRPGRIMVVDDCSRDLTGPVVAGYMAGNPGWINYLRMPVTLGDEIAIKAGLEAVRNEGITYMVCLMSGDTLTGDAIERLSTAMREGYADMAGHSQDERTIEGWLVKADKVNGMRMSGHLEWIDKDIKTAEAPAGLYVKRKEEGHGEDE